MAKGIIGEPFTFTVLYVDASGDPITPTSSTIEVFYFDTVGAKQSLAAPGTVMAAVGGDPGRYAYTFTIPGALTPADQIYGVMIGVDPATGMDIVVEQEVDPFEPGSGAIEIQDEGVSLGTFTVINSMWAVWLPFTSRHSLHRHHRPMPLTGTPATGTTATSPCPMGSPAPPHASRPPQEERAHPSRQVAGQARTRAPRWGPPPPTPRLR